MKAVILAYFIALLWCVSGLLAPVVQTNSGKVEGVKSLLDGLPAKMFLGIPYAKPPVGDLRFLRTSPVEPWSDTLKATKLPPGCMQYTEAPYPWYDNMTGKSEDCLYLNIYTPILANPRSKLPVLFWIHGGGLTLGSSRQEVYDGRPLASRENVILVTINYRLGAFGFLSTNTSQAPGNVGIYDQILALQWVNDNIQNFGGDKNKITVFGESAGSISTSILCVSPLTKGLFHRAILESGSTIYYKNSGLDYNLGLGQKLAVEVGCATPKFTIYNHPNEIADCLRKTDALDLVKSQWKLNPWSTGSFFPQYGDSLLPNNALDDIRKGNFNNIPLLIGNNKDEGSLFISTSNPETFGFFGEKNFKVNKSYAETLVSAAFTGFPNQSAYVDHYLKGVSDSNSEELRYQTYTSYGDTIALCGTVFFAESYSKYGNDVHFYYFTHRPSNSVWADWLGVAHYDEVQFVFGRPVRVRKDYKLNEVTLSKKMMKVWANFAKNGSPAKFPKWPKYTKGDNTYFTLDVKNYGTLGKGPHLENCNFLRSYYGF